MPVIETITIITTSIISIINAVRHLHIYRDKQKRRKHKDKIYRRHSV